MFDIRSPNWFGFIEAIADYDSSWKTMECPTAHLFAVGISWVSTIFMLSTILIILQLVVTAHFDFLNLRAVTTRWVSNARVDAIKELTKFLESWLLAFWMRSGVPTQAERTEGIAFMLRYGLSPLQAF